MDDFNDSGGSVGSWFDGLSRLTGQVLAYRQATAPGAIRWQPYGAGQSVQYGVGANGEVLTRGLPAPSASPLGAFTSLLPLLVIGGVIFFAIRALK